MYFMAWYIFYECCTTLCIAKEFDGCVGFSILPLCIAYINCKKKADEGQTSSPRTPGSRLCFVICHNELSIRSMVLACEIYKMQNSSIKCKAVPHTKTNTHQDTYSLHIFSRDTVEFHSNLEKYPAAFVNAHAHQLLWSTWWVCFAMNTIQVITIPWELWSVATDDGHVLYDITFLDSMMMTWGIFKLDHIQIIDKQATQGCNLCFCFHVLRTILRFLLFKY